MSVLACFELVSASRLRVRLRVCGRRSLVSFVVALTNANEDGEDDDDDVDDKIDDDVVNDDSGDDVDDAAGGQKETRVYRQWNKAEKRVLTHAASAIVEAYYDPKLKKKKDRQYGTRQTLVRSSVA